MIGMRVLPASHSRMRRVASKPSISGIWTSIIMRSKDAVLTAERASLPLFGECNGMPETFEHALSYFLIHPIIIGDENA